VLVIEDNPSLVKINMRALQRAGFEVFAALDLEHARKSLADHVPDVVLLDIMLPDGDGIVFAREIRHSIAAPIIFLTSLHDELDEVAALEAGGDDFLRKPYSIRVLVAKVNAFMRRSQISERLSSGVLKAGNVAIDTAAQSVCVDGARIILTPKELTLLATLVRKQGSMVDSDELCQAAWGHPLGEDLRALWTQMSRLKRKMEDAGATVAIKSVRGSGYSLDVVLHAAV